MSMVFHNLYTVPTLEILITSECNLRCKYCFEDKENKNNLDVDKLIDILRWGTPQTSVYIFGGEPLANINGLEKLLNYFKEEDRLFGNDKEKLISSCRGITTNGTLIKKNRKFIKENNIDCQISIDGCEDSCNSRVFPNGKPAFDKIKESIDFCNENKINYSMHGVFSKDNIEYFHESVKFFFECYKKREISFNRINPIDNAILSMMSNWAQIVFEDEWNDSDIDIFIEQNYRVAEWINENNELSKTQKIKLFNVLFSNCDRGGSCGAGVGLAIIDENMKIFPCHRICQNNKKKELFDVGNFYYIHEATKKYWNSINRIGRKNQFMYSACYDRGPKSDMVWIAWCPATNLEVSDNIYYQNSKYSVFIYEVNRAIKDIRNSYFSEV